jgi:hypothetical protein
MDPLCRPMACDCYVCTKEELDKFKEHLARLPRSMVALLSSGWLTHLQAIKVAVEACELLDLSEKRAELHVYDALSGLRQALRKTQQRMSTRELVNKFTAVLKDKDKSRKN